MRRLPDTKILEPTNAHALPRARVVPYAGDLRPRKWKATARRDPQGWGLGTRDWRLGTAPHQGRTKDYGRTKDQGQFLLTPPSAPPPDRPTRREAQGSSTRRARR